VLQAALAASLDPAIARDSRVSIHQGQSQTMLARFPALSDGLPWRSFFRDTQLIPELANANVRLDMLTDDIQRLGGACKSAKG